MAIQTQVILPQTNFVIQYAYFLILLSRILKDVHQRVTFLNETGHFLSCKHMAIKTIMTSLTIWHHCFSKHPLFML